MDLNKLTLGDKILGGAGILLILDLLLFPWHSVDLGIVTINRQATESPNAFWGVLALLVTIAIVAVVIVRRLTTANLPELPIAWNLALFYAAIATLAILFIKLVSETSSLGFGAWFGLLLAAAMVYGGFVMSKETDEAPGPLA
ncbi:MAG TPA: hypothetical protein VFK42_06335 [Acidimicrobiales bacterium]|nr:hypothetical protein [Acidimicrobiales bacterium]